MHDEREPEVYPSPRYAWYVVGVLTLAYVVSFIDRQILSLLVGPIQRDLEISDTRLSLLMGASFAVFYTLFGIPLGRLADTRSRRMIITVGIAFWSVMTAGCGVAKRFWELALMRMGVGVGEATLSPSAYSLIADYFPPERRATAMSVYSMGIYIGSGLAYILGGIVVGFASAQESFLVPLVGAVRSWQMVFFIVGLPGLLVALLLLLTVREPTRKGLESSRHTPVCRPPSQIGRSLPSASVPVPASVRETWAYIRDNYATFLCLNFGVALVTLNAYGASSWVPTLFARRHGWLPGQTGIVYGLIVAVCGTLGIVTGGWLADRWSRQGRTDATLRVALLGTAVWLPFGVLFPIAPSGTWVAVLLGPALFFGSMPFGVAPAAIQRMMPNTMRAQATAMYLFVINLIGLGLGPTVVAVLTERVFGDKAALHYSLLIVGAVSHLSAALLLWIGLKNYRRSLEYFDAWTRRS